MKDGRKVIDDLIKKEIVVQSEGAWIVDLEEEKLGANLLVRSDGAMLYNGKDIVLALRKEKDFSPQRSIYVIDARQSLAMKQLFATLARMGFEREVEHLSYEFVTLSSGAMSSRKGNVVDYHTFRDAMVDRAREETTKRHEDWNVKQIEKVSRSIAFAAMRFSMLKQDLDKKIVFDLDEALSFDGFTGPYLLYTYARIRSISRKAKGKAYDLNADGLKDPSEHKLLKLLSDYPEVVFRVSQSMQLNLLPQYLFDLSKAFAEFYASVNVLKAEDELQARRLGLLVGVQQVLENGFKLLGIDPVEEM